jgi:hypothetical protein
LMHSFCPLFPDTVQLIGISLNKHGAAPAVELIIAHMSFVATSMTKPRRETINGFGLNEIYTKTGNQHSLEQNEHTDGQTSSNRHFTRSACDKRNVVRTFPRPSPCSTVNSLRNLF